MRARRFFGNRDDNGLTGPRVFFTQRHAAHLQINGQFSLVNGKQRQILSLEVAFLDGAALLVELWRKKVSI